MSLIVKKRNKPVIVSPLLQLVLTCISVSIISFGLYKRIGEHIFTDKVPEIQYFTPDTLREFKTSPVAITTGLNIDKFQEFDMEQNNFIFSGTLWFSFDPGAISLKTLEKFDFAKGKILERTQPDMRYMHEKLLVRYRVKVQFTTPLDYKDFPLDNHRIFLKLTNTDLYPEEVIFDTAEKNFIVQASVKDSGWKFVGKDVESGFAITQLTAGKKEVLNSYPVAIFILKFLRDGIRYALSIFLPLLFLFYLMLFTFSLDPDRAIPVGSAIVTALLAYRFVIERISPQGVGYFMLSDQLFFLLLGLISLFFVLNAIDRYAHPFSYIEKVVILVIFHVFTVVANLVLFFT